ncbi:MAG: flagellar biosynthetic protein FliR [Marinosulfonomonas sp.]
MTSQLTGLFQIDPDWLVIGFLVFLRVGAAMALLPALGEKSVPQRIRLLIGVLLALVVFPGALPWFPAEIPSGSGLVLFVGAEVVAGLTIGVSLRLFVHALQITGAIVAQSTSLSQIFGGAGLDPQPAIGHVLVIAGLALAVTLGLHVKFVQLILFSYQLFTPGKFLLGSGLSEWGVMQIARVFALAFSLAAPFVVATLIYNIALGAINRAMPQLMVSFVGAPAITAGGLVMLAIITPLILSVWHIEIESFIANPFGGQP